MGLEIINELFKEKIMVNLYKNFQMFLYLSIKYYDIISVVFKSEKLIYFIIYVSISKIYENYYKINIE